nr:MAG TPA: hypothetical protein [Microviridae sp.]
MKRRSMSSGESRKNFSQGNKSKAANFRPRPTRGGYRL